MSSSFYGGVGVLFNKEYASRIVLPVFALQDDEVLVIKNKFEQTTSAHLSNQHGTLNLEVDND